MHIESIAYRHTHEEDFIVERPKGIGCWFFLLVRTPAWLIINGKKETVREGTAVFFDGVTPCSYGACGEFYAEDWFYAKCEDGDENFIKSINLPISTPIYIGNSEEFSQMIHIMVCEHYSAGEFREAIEKDYLRIFLMKLSRVAKSGGCYSPSIFVDRNAKLSHLRTRMYNMPKTVPDVEGMAKEVGMSRSGFQHLYKRYFGFSVMDDVINGRIEYAKHLLSITELPVADIADQCGYGTVYHFMKQFKCICGKTPTQFRNNE